MNAAHTNEKIRYFCISIKNGYEFELRADYAYLGKLFGSTNPMWDAVPGAQEADANAKRLVACWNHFHGVPTAEIEAMTAAKLTGDTE